ncbi:MAG: peptide chain release factor N(5)-glutamine methyltransferase [Rudaea sp.]
MTAVRALLAEAREVLHVENPSREGEILLACALDKTRAWLFAHATDEVDDEVAGRYRAMLARRHAGEPIAYITGHREFRSLDLLVTPAVLIPRPDTELLVEIALRHIPQSAKVDIADLGTGSGAIALAIASERPDARIIAVDSCAAALDVARANAQRLRIDNVEFRHSDWFEALGDVRFDMIVSNPPYIPLGDEHLSQGDLRFEPAQALSAGDDGLDAIRTIVARASSHLRKNGRVLLEHGFDQGAAVRNLLERHGFDDVFTEQDIEARDRVSGGTLRET